MPACDAARRFLRMIYRRGIGRNAALVGDNLPETGEPNY
jgi:hypothetical protein